MAGALIGALRVSLSAETTAFEAGMNRSQAIAKRTAANMNTAFGGTTKILERTALRFAEVLTLAAIVRAGKAALDYAGHLGELADTLGLTTKDLQTFSYAAGQVGISQDELQTGIQKLTISMGQAEVGAKKQINAFNAIGISVTDLKNKTTGDIFREIADKLQTVSDRSQRAAIEVALFGKSGAKLDNLLSGAQGSLSELSDAAEKLGIVLSEQQIRDADKTADKLEALKTVLKANIASAVANNANAIYGLIDALARLVSKLPTAIRAYQAFVAAMTIAGGKLQALDPTNTAAGQAEGRLRVAQGQSELRDLRNQQAGGKSFEERAAALRQRLGLGGGAPAPHGTDLPQFLASEKKPKKAKEDHTAEKLAREAYDAQRQELQAQQDILQAKRDLSEDYVEQTSISVDILNNQREQKVAELDYAVKQHALTKGLDGLTQAQADRQLASFDIADSLKRQKLLQDEQEQRQRDVGELADHDFERRKELLGKLEDLATTQSERRKIELDILELAYQEKKQALERIVNESKNAKEIEDARRDLASLSANHAADKASVIKNTRNPLEEWAASVPHTAAEINEALQSIEVKGLDGLTDAITGVITGTESLKSAFHNLAASILADLIQMTIKMLLFKALSSVLGGSLGGSSGVGASPSFPASGTIGPRAAGGPVMANSLYLVGEKGPELFMPKTGGSIIPNHRLKNVGNDNSPSRSVALTFNNDFRGADPSAVASINAKLDRMQAELPGNILATMGDARDRFIWRNK